MKTFQFIILSVFMLHSIDALAQSTNYCFECDGNRTVGFKSSRVTFQDVLSQSVATTALLVKEIEPIKSPRTPSVCGSL